MSICGGSDQPLAALRSLQVRLKAQNKIKVNGQVTRTNYWLQPGDIVTVGIDLEETSDITPLYAPWILSTRTPIAWSSISRREWRSIRRAGDRR